MPKAQKWCRLDSRTRPRSELWFEWKKREHCPKFWSLDSKEVSLEGVGLESRCAGPGGPSEENSALMELQSVMREVIENLYNSAYNQNSLHLDSSSFTLLRAAPTTFRYVTYSSAKNGSYRSVRHCTAIEWKISEYTWRKFKIVSFCSLKRDKWG